MLNIFPCSVRHFLSSLEKCHFSFSFCPFLNLVVCFLILSLYVLDINLLSVISFASIFSHSIGCLFILSMISFAVQKLSSLLRSYLFIFGFVSIILGDRSPPSQILWFMSRSVLPMFSSRSFIVFSLKFRSLIHFEFIFVYSIRECSNFILLHVTVLFSQHYLLKRLSFLHCIFLSPLYSWP